MPIGSAIKAPSATDSAESWRCSTSLTGIPSEPCQWAGSVNHWTTLARMLTVSFPARPRHRQPLRASEPQVGRERQHDGQDCRNHEWRVEAFDQTFEDQLTQTAQADYCCDRHDPDR